MTLGVRTTTLWHRALLAAWLVLWLSSGGGDSFCGGGGSGGGSNVFVAAEEEATSSEESSSSPTCYEWTGAACSWEPNLKPMTVHFEGRAKNDSFYAYVHPDVSSFYNESDGKRQTVASSFPGLFGKFINLSPDPVRVWYQRPGSGDLIYSADVDPFGSAGTATYVGHVFLVTPPNQQSKVLTTWNVKAGQHLYYYDPFDFDIHKAHKKLSEAQYVYYHMQWHNRKFAAQYKEFTGREWLALYQQKQAPRFHMWRADALGQVHQVTTKEIHFVEAPPAAELKRGSSAYGPRPDVITRNRQYRHQQPTLTLNLKVLSCAPRVFEISNFLSDVEVEHLLQLAAASDMHRSSVSAGGGSQRRADSNTRTSTNSWIARHSDIVTDALYRRAADVLHMDEALLRWRHPQEIPEFTESKISVAEHLQCVHYEPGQEYTAHHDFTMPSLVNLQPSRFATILFYLNDDMEGGETAFPRWQNAETSGPLLVKPEKGKAILFYSLLPDGNYDDLSQHAALPVRSGEKWLTNLWVWDPVMDHSKQKQIH